MKKLAIVVLVVALIVAVVLVPCTALAATYYQAPRVIVDDGSLSAYMLPTYAGVTYFYCWSTIKPFLVSGELAGLPTLTPEELEDIVGIPFDQRMGYLRWLGAQTE